MASDGHSGAADMLLLSSPGLFDDTEGRRRAALRDLHTCRDSLSGQIVQDDGLDHVRLLSSVLLSRLSRTASLLAVKADATARPPVR